MATLLWRYTQTDSPHDELELPPDERDVLPSLVGLGHGLQEEEPWGVGGEGGAEAAEAEGGGGLGGGEVGGRL